MKYFIFILLLSTCSATKANLKINVCDILVSVDTNCKAEFFIKNEAKTFSFSFKKKGECRLITHSKTNVAHIQFVNGMYVLLVENNINGNDECYSEYSRFWYR